MQHLWRSKVAPAATRWRKREIVDDEARPQGNGPRSQLPLFSLVYLVLVVSTGQVPTGGETALARVCSW